MPDIYRYLDFRDYLRDWFEAKKAADPSFSRRSFSRLAGKSSPGLLTEIIGGRRVTERTVRAIASALGLSRADSDFLRALVELDQADTMSERNRAWERIAASRQFQSARAVDGASVRYASEWYIPVVEELARRSDFRSDPGWIASRVRPPITVARARAALETLELLGKLRESGGRWTPTDVVAEAPGKVADLAAANYHRAMLARAAEALEGSDATERHFRGATVSVPASALPKLRDALDSFHEEVVELCESSAGAGQVVQVHLVAFPLSEPPAPEG